MSVNVYILMNTIYSKSIGRLGNIFYKVVIGKYLAKKHNMNYKLVWNNNTLYDKEKQDYFIYFPCIDKNDLVYSVPKNINVQKEIYSTKYEELNINDSDIFLEGYMQCPKYWDNDKKFAQELLRPSKELIKEINELYDIKFNEYVSINVRRGDYLKPCYDNIVVNHDADYYKHIMNSLYRKSQKYIVSSDDIDWCKEQFKEYDCIYVDKISEKYPKFLIDLYIQTLCKDNIISNSTFSWWGAYLNTNKDRRVFYSLPWFKDCNSLDFLPINDNWINVDAMCNKTFISNDCMSAALYKNCLNIGYNNPFMWVWFSLNDFKYLIEKYDSINFQNFYVDKIQNHKNINKFKNASTFKSYKNKLYYLNIDNKIDVCFPHYIEDAKYKELKVSQCGTITNVYFNDMKSFITEKYKSRLNSSLRPVFLLHQKSYYSEKEMEEFLEGLQTEYQVYVFTSYNLYQYIKFKFRNFNNLKKIKIHSCLLNRNLIVQNGLLKQLNNVKIH